MGDGDGAGKATHARCSASHMGRGFANRIAISKSPGNQGKLSSQNNPNLPADIDVSSTGR